MGILVGTAERSVSISVNLVDNDSRPESSVTGGTMQDLAIGAEGSSWNAVISTSEGEFEVEARVEEVEGQHTFTYEVTNLSHEGSESGVEFLSLAIPLAGNARPADIRGSAGWDSEASAGSLGGFLVYRSENRRGVPLGETARFEFSLPARPSLDDPGEQSSELPLPPGLFVGADLQASPDAIRVIRPLETSSEQPRPLADPGPDWLCREGSPWYFSRPDGRGICILGTLIVDPEAGAGVLLHIKTSNAPRAGSPPEQNAPGDEVLVALPLRPGQAASPTASAPEGWKFEAPNRPGSNPGFAVFSGVLEDREDTVSSLRMDFDRAEFAGIAAGFTSSCINWNTGQCTVEVSTRPGNVRCKLVVFHWWIYWATGLIESESFSFDGTTDEEGRLSWTFSVDTLYVGPGGRVRTEGVDSKLYWVSSSTHASELMDFCLVQIWTLSSGETVETNECGCD
jgi:hypothetical protein